jgi:glucokinase
MIGAVDIGGTKIAAGLVDEKGRLHARRQMPVRRQMPLVEGMREIARMIDEACAESGADLEGVGIACTGQIDPASGALKSNAFLPTWAGANLAQELMQHLGVSTALENDADAAALGEAAWGAGQDSRRFILVTVGTGIGCGLVFDGQLYRGVNGFHPEPGHHVVDPAGPLCFCGARGCWESMASGPALSRWLDEKARELGLKIPRLSAAQICALAGQHDPLAIRAIEREGYYLGLGLANLITIFAPDVIALGGSVMRSWPLFSESAWQVVRQNCGLVPHQETRILPAHFGSEASLIGAAQVWRSLHNSSAGI